MKERIKQQRQLSTLKNVHIQQSAQRKDVLQEYRLMFQRAEGSESQHNLQFMKSTSKPSLQVHQADQPMLPFPSYAMVLIRFS